MTTPPRFDADDAKIVPLFTAEEHAQSEALSRYWDATIRGQPLDAAELDPELKTVVHLLRHYHAVTRHHRDAHEWLRTSGEDLPPPIPRETSPSPERTSTHAGTHAPRYHASLAALMVGVLAIIFAFNAVVSERSWLLSRANDPDWIPWVSDEWLGFNL